MDDVVATISEQVAGAQTLLAEVLGEVASLTEQAAVSGEPVGNDERLRVLLVGLERVRNVLEASQAEAMIAIGDQTRAWDPCYEQFVPDEIAALLACSKMAGSVRYGIACQARLYPALGAAWRSGSIDARKVSLIGDQLQPLRPEATTELAAAAAAYAASHTPSQTRAWLARRIITADPATAEARRESAMAQRCVVITPGQDGMSTVWAWLPSVQARQVQQVLTTMAHELGEQDARGMDQRRADVFVDLLVGRATPPSVELLVLATPDTLTGGDQPAWLAGVGPITATQTRELIADPATGALPDPATGALPDVGLSRLRTLSKASEPGYRPSAGLQRMVRARDVTCRFPGCRRSAFGTHSGTDLDHTIPWPRGATDATNLAVLCRRHHRLKHTGLWHVDLHPDGTMTWHSPSGRNFQTQAWQDAHPPP